MDIKFIMRLVSNRNNKKFQNFNETCDDDELDLMTPYIKRSLSTKMEPTMIRVETIIEDWLSERDIRLVTLENIQHEQRNKATSMTMLPSFESKVNRFSSISSPSKDGPSLNLLDNSLFMKRKISSMRDTELS